MPEKSYLLRVVLALILGFLAASSISLATDAGPETMELKTSAAKKPARFPHKKHQGSFACRECHHTKTGDSVKSPYVDGMQIRKCITCHNIDDMKNPKLNSFKLASHGLCKECHRQHKDAAPTTCTGCHIK
jgi:hypothetical protein